MAGVLLLLLSACGAPGATIAQQFQPPSPPSSSPTRSSDQSAPRRDELPLGGSGLTLVISAPKLFVPTEAAYPRSARAVGFEMTISNRGQTVYRPSQLSITAVANGSRPLSQVRDSTQGYTGLVGSDDVPPGKHVRVSVAFAVDPEPAVVRVVVQPDASAQDKIVVFEGTI